MSYYEALKTVHVLFAVIWVGGAVALQLMAWRILAAEDYDRVAKFGKDAEFIGMRVFLPSSVIVLLLGILMVVEEPAWGFGDAWIVIGLVMIFASALTGALYLGPEGGRLADIVTARGPEDPEYKSRLARLLTISRIEMVALLVIVANMVIKPGA